MNRCGWALVLCAVANTGCSFLSPREDPSRFFLLTSPPTVASQSSPEAAGAIAIGPLELPGYLAGPTLVTRVDEHEVVVSAYERWAEPLQDGFARVLVASVSDQITSREVVVFPALLSEELRYRVPVRVERFERDASGGVELWASWSIDDVEDGRTLESRRSRIMQPSLGAGTEATVAAMSQALQSLSREIADALRAVESG